MSWRIPMALGERLAKQWNEEEDEEEKKKIAKKSWALRLFADRIRDNTY